MSSFGPGSTVRLRAPFWLERFGNGLQHERRTRIANNGMTGKTVFANSSGDFSWAVEPEVPARIIPWPAVTVFVWKVDDAMDRWN